MYDMHNQLAFRPLISAAVLTASSANVKVDRQGYEALELVFDIGVGGITFTGTNRVDFTATHSDDDITYTAVSDADLLGVTGTTGGIIKSLIVAHAAGDITKIGYIGSKRYVKLPM